MQFLLLLFPQILTIFRFQFFLSWDLFFIGLAAMKFDYEGAGWNKQNKEEYYGKKI